MRAKHLHRYVDELAERANIIGLTHLECLGQAVRQLDGHALSYRVLAQPQPLPA